MIRVATGAELKEAITPGLDISLSQVTYLVMSLYGFLNNSVKRMLPVFSEIAFRTYDGSLNFAAGLDLSSPFCFFDLGLGNHCDQKSTNKPRRRMCAVPK